MTVYIKKAELHCHSNSTGKVLPYAPFLYDSVQECEEILEEAVSKSIKILSITDHDSLEGYRRAKKIIFQKNLDVLLIPGCEISTKDGHVLAYGISKEIPKKLAAEETVQKIHEQGGVAVVAHPFMIFSLKSKIAKIHFDALEGYNSSIPGKANTKAREAADKLGLPCIAGSDAHLSSSIGDSIVLFKDTVATQDDVLQNALTQKRKFSQCY